jgi:transposase
MGAIGPLLPQNQPGARRTDDRRVISGIVHVLKTGCRWQDCRAVYGPPTTVYNRFRPWTMRGIWRRLFDALARADPGDGQAIDNTTAKAHRSAAGGKGGAEAQAIGRSRGGRTTKIHAIESALHRWGLRRIRLPQRSPPRPACSAVIILCQAAASATSKRQAPRVPALSREGGASLISLSTVMRQRAPDASRLAPIDRSGSTPTPR